MGPSTKIFAEEQIAGKTLDLGGIHSREHNAPATINLHEGVPGAKDALCHIQGELIVDGDFELGGFAPFVKSNPSGAFKKIVAMEFNPVTNEIRLAYET